MVFLAVGFARESGPPGDWFLSAWCYDAGPMLFYNVIMTETIDRLETRPLSCDQAVQRLRALEPEIRALGVSSLYLFGSTARNEARPDSDLDLFGELIPGSRRGFDYFSLPGELSDLLRRKVDFIERDSLHPRLRDRIIASGVRVF